MVLFNLPSRAPGNSNTCYGKVSIHSSGITCSSELSFDRSSLENLSINASELYRSLKGKISIESLCGNFGLEISAMAKGHIKIDSFMKNHQFSSPENGKWKSEVCFYDYPECLNSLIKAIDEIKS